MESKNTNTVAVAARGIIIDEVPEALWLLPGVFQFVTIQVSSANSSIPRTYRNVPWPYTSGLDMWVHRPRANDYVDIVFKGGSSENPTVVAHHPGHGTVEARTQATQPRAVVPAENILHSAWDMIKPITTLFPELDILNKFL